MKKGSINLMPIIWTYKNFTAFNTSNDCKLTNKLKDILTDFVKKTLTVIMKPKRKLNKLSQKLDL